jgi:glucose-1-phosphate thymidylyltransferase
MKSADTSAVLTEAQRHVADTGLKAMMPIGGRVFLDYVLSSLADAGYRDVAAIVGPEHTDIRRHYDVEVVPTRVTLTFLIQERPLGTANAVLAARAWIGDAGFVVLNADNLYPVDTLRALARLDEPGLPVFEMSHLVATSNIASSRVATFALVDVDREGYLSRIVEKPDAAERARAGDRALVSMNCWRFDRRIFQACEDVQQSARGEFELPQAVGLAIERGIRFRAIPASGPVLDISARADVAEVVKRLEGRPVEP